MGATFESATTPAAGRIRLLLCRLGLSRAEGRPGDPGAKSLLNLVGMKPDSPGGRSREIRTTCHRTEHFSERKFSHECGLRTFVRATTVDALFRSDRPSLAQRAEGQSGTANAFYHQADGST